MLSAKITILSSGQPSLNPRLVKEADALADAGYHVTVIYVYWNDWGTALDEKMLPGKKWKAIRAGGSPTDDKFNYNVSRILQKAAQKLYSLTGRFAEYAVSRGTRALYLKACEQQADLYIGHNMGALAPTIWAAANTKKKCGFDAEDYHRNETSNDPLNHDVRLKKQLEETYFPQLHYLTAASPLIAKEYQKLFPQLKITSILNVFPRATSSWQHIEQRSESLKLFWFSQTIGKNRGLEEVFEAFGNIGDSRLQLHLLGDLRPHDKEYFERLTLQHHIMPEQICFYPPIPSDDIISFASNFDIGLATETGYPYNRDICLTNKIFTYIQSGLAVLGTDTTAQINLLKDHPHIGYIYKRGNSQMLEQKIAHYLNNPNDLDNARSSSYLLGQTKLNWDTEKNVFLRMIHHLHN